MTSGNKLITVNQVVQTDKQNIIHTAASEMNIVWIIQ